MARARCCGSPRRSRWCPICLRRSWSRRCRACANTRARSPTASSARLRRAWRSPASPAPTARPPAPIYWRRRWKHCGRPAAYMGTIGTGRPGSLIASGLTTGDAITVQRTLASLRAGGATSVAMEVSSHALDQARVGAVRFRTAAFTNLTRDHLDYHGTMESYGADQGAAVHARRPGVARDQRRRRVRPPARHRSARPWPRDRHEPRSSVANAQRGGFRARHARHLSVRGIELEFDSSWGTGGLVCPLVGDFNVDNLLTVIAVLLDWDLPLEQVIACARRTCAPRPAAWKLSAARGRRSRWSTTRTRPTRCARRWRRRARIAPVVLRWSSAAAAIATRASGRSWAASRPNSPTTS